VSDDELIGLARTIIEAGRRGDKIRGVNRLPDLPFRFWIVYLAYELNGRPWPTGSA
jgi:hypothetical protein